MSEDINIKGLKHFDGTNFQLWKYQMLQVFTALGVKKVVLGEELRPEEDSVKEEAWDRTNARAAVLLTGSISAEHFQQVNTCDIAKQIWDKMYMIHEECSATNRQALLQKFHQLKMEETDTVVTYLSKIQNLARQLKGVKEPVSDNGVIVKIIGGLPKKFGAFITAWDSVDPDRQNIATLQERLMREEKRLSADEETVNAFASINLNYNKSKQVNEHRQNERQGQSTLVCFYCGTKGHIARAGRKKKRDQAQRQESKQSRPANTHAQGQSSSNSNSARFTGGLTALVDLPTKVEANAITCETKHRILTADIKEIWLTDSGATCHITPRREWFTEYATIDPIDVRLGDGSCKKGVGVGKVMDGLIMCSMFPHSRRICFRPKCPRARV